MASTDPNIIPSVLQNIVAEKTGKTPSQENSDEFFFTIAQPLRKLFSNLTPTDWLIIMQSYKYEKSAIYAFSCIFIEHLPKYEDVDTCVKCTFIRIDRIMWYIFPHIHSLLYHTVSGFTEHLHIKQPIYDCTYTFNQCFEVMENGPFISKLLDIIPEICSKFYEYLSENISTMKNTITEEPLDERHSLYNEYDDYFCQKRCAGYLRCCSEAVSEGGMCEKHMSIL
jgi:hypothetical protein